LLRSSHGLTRYCSTGELGPLPHGGETIKKTPSRQIISSVDNTTRLPMHEKLADAVQIRAVETQLET